MTHKKIDLSRRKILGGLGSVGMASVGAGLGTSAYFSDREEFDANQLTAGELDMKVGWSEHYSDWSDDEDGSTTSTTDDDVSVRMYPGSGTGGPGELQSGETGLPANDDWLIAVDDPDQFLANTEQEAQDLPADPCTGLDVPDDHDQPVIDLADVKPGDFGEVTIDFTLCDNPGYVWLFGDLDAASENGKTEPEGDDPDENASIDPSGLSTDYVELLDAVQAAVWVDDGDNYQDGTESYAFSGSLREVLAELDSENGLPLVGNIDAAQAGGTGRDCFSAVTANQPDDQTHSVVFAWWLPVDHANEIQTDSVEFSLGLYTEQCRHNDGNGLQIAPTQPTVFEITEGVGTTSGQTFDLDTEVGFADPMVTSVDTSTDPVVFTLEVPEELDKAAGDQWSVVIDADNDGTVDFRIVYDDFFYQEWDEQAGDWGPEQPVPADIETDIVDGIYLLELPRDRLSDPFRFAGRLCYGAAPIREGLCITLTPGLDPTNAVGPDTNDFQQLAFRERRRDNTDVKKKASKIIGSGFKQAGQALAPIQDQIQNTEHLTLQTTTAIMAPRLREASAELQDSAEQLRTLHNHNLHRWPYNRDLLDTYDKLGKTLEAASRSLAEATGENSSSTSQNGDTNTLADMVGNPSLHTFGSLLQDVARLSLSVVGPLDGKEAPRSFDADVSDHRRVALQLSQMGDLLVTSQQPGGPTHVLEETADLLSQPIDEIQQAANDVLAIEDSTIRSYLGVNDPDLRQTLSDIDRDVTPEDLNKWAVAVKDQPRAWTNSTLLASAGLSTGGLGSAYVGIGDTLQSNFLCIELGGCGGCSCSSTRNCKLSGVGVTSSPKTSPWDAEDMWIYFGKTFKYHPKTPPGSGLVLKAAKAVAKKVAMKRPVVWVQIEYEECNDDCWCSKKCDQWDTKTKQGHIKGPRGGVYWPPVKQWDKKTKKKIAKRVKKKKKSLCP